VLGELFEQQEHAEQRPVALAIKTSPAAAGFERLTSLKSLCKTAGSVAVATIAGVDAASRWAIQ